MHGDRHSVFRRYLPVSRASVCAVALGAMLAFPAGVAEAARGGQERIEGFGPFMIGMPRDRAKAVNDRAKEQDCGEIASERQCIALKAAVFEEPAVIYAVLDETGGKVEKVVAELAPELTRRRAFRCVRLSEKVFALLVVVYGPDYKQSYDEDRRPLPAVAWDGALAGRLVFEAKCRTSDEGNPRITVIEYYPDGVKPPPVAQETPPATAAEATPAVPGPSIDAAAAADESIAIASTAAQPPAPPVASSDLTLVPAEGEAPVPLSAPIGVVEQIAPGAPDTSGATDANSALAALTRELKIARSTPETETPQAAPDVPSVDSPPANAADSAAPQAQPVPQETAPAGTASAEGGGSPTVAVDITPPPADAAGTAANSRDLRSEPDPASAPPPPATQNPSTVASDAAPVEAVPPTVDRASAPAAVEVKPVETKSVAAPPAEQTPPTAVASLPPVQQTPTQAVPDRSAAPRSAGETGGPAATAKPQRVEQKPAAVAALTYRRPVPVVGPTVRPPSYGDAADYPLPTDLEAPEPFMVPEEEELFRQRREASDSAAVPAKPSLTAEVERRLAAAPSAPGASRTPSPPVSAAPSNDAAGAPISLFSSSRDAGAGSAGRETPRTSTEAAARAPANVERRSVAAAPVARPEAPAPVPPSPAVERSAVAAEPTAAPDVQAESSVAAVESASTVAEASDGDGALVPGTVFPDGWGNAEQTNFTPVQTGGWRRRAPVPPAKPWRVRETSALETESDV